MVARVLPSRARANRAESGRMAFGETFESVLAAAQSGAEWAFARLYDELNPRLERYFSARAPRSAEDLAADVWMGVARGLPKFQGDETGFRSWVFTIAHRRLADHWEETRRQGAESARDPAGLEDYQAPDDPQDEVLEVIGARAAVQRISSLLTPDQAEVVLLRLLGGLDVEQVAAITGKRPGTIRVLQHRAVKKLAQELTLEEVTG
jgi:RNA polymerase sigma-70 factor (ECF subfamily)